MAHQRRDVLAGLHWPPQRPGFWGLASQQQALNGSVWLLMRLAGVPLAGVALVGLLVQPLPSAPGDACRDGKGLPKKVYTLEHSKCGFASLYE